LRNLLEGAASHSYGIHVARLAGMPAGVIERAKEILAQLEGSQGNRGDSFHGSGQSPDAVPLQMGLFGAPENRLRDQLSQLDVARMTPIEALNLLHKLSEEAKK
jgi:DNA mismatch repair protein MutS